MGSQNFDRALQYLSLSDQIRSCRKCPGLNKEGVTESAPGFGNISARVMIVGQSLCRKCMVTQIPFSGGSGRLLDRAFAQAGIKKTDVFITNVVHCHTPNNRKSLPLEITNCHHFLLRELALVRPRALVLLGEDAVISILGREAWPFRVGDRVTQDHYVIYPMYHPSYIRRKGATEANHYVESLAHVFTTYNSPGLAETTH
jgi:uracil-DNA glycosylase